VEKAGMSTTEIHVKNALFAKRRIVSIEAGSLHILNPAGRSKQHRIESALLTPLKNGKIHILDSIPYEYRERLCVEMDKFPHFHEDGLDMLSYVYDVIKDCRFGMEENEAAKKAAQEKHDKWNEAFERAKQAQQFGGRGYLTV
jgi:hypothetical protein